MRIYIDHNATSPVRPHVAAAMAEARAVAWANPASPHGPGQDAAMALDRARASVARSVGRLSRDVFFTSGATEANAWVLSRARTEARPLVVGSAIEHPSVRAWLDLEVPVHVDGTLDLDALKALIQDRGSQIAIFSLMAANNESGVVQPVNAAAELVRAAGIPLHCDATQLCARAPIHVDADFLTLSAHKGGGPKGVGALIGAPAHAMLRGGPQERGLRAGTVNVEGASGLAATLEKPWTPRPELRDALQAACVALGGDVLGAGAPRLWNTLCVRFDVPGDLIAISLDLEGIAVSTGSACSSGSAEESHVSRAMGRNGLPLRFSFGSEEVDVSRVAATLGAVLARARGVQCA